MELKLSNAWYSSPIPVKLEISYNKCCKVIPGFLTSGYKTKEVGAGLPIKEIKLVFICQHLPMPPNIVL